MGLRPPRPAPSDPLGPSFRWEDPFEGFEPPADPGLDPGESRSLGADRRPLAMTET